MATSPEFTDYVLDQLEAVGPIETKRMFGGVLLRVDNQQLGVILLDVLYLKAIDASLHERLAALGSEQFTYERKDRNTPMVIKNWWSVPEEVLEDREQLLDFAVEVMRQDR